MGFFDDRLERNSWVRVPSVASENACRKGTFAILVCKVNQSINRTLKVIDFAKFESDWMKKLEIIS